VEIIQSIPQPSLSVQNADDTVLREMQARCHGIEDHYPHKAVLYIGSEQYDAMIVTLLEGLQELGFTIHTIDKPNVNSWFCNQPVDIQYIEDTPVDFAISNLGWGIRWSLYDDIPAYPSVFIDGHVGRGPITWQQKLDKVNDGLQEKPQDQAVLDQQIQPYPWYEHRGDYEPTLVLTAQPYKAYDAVYQPIGIQRAFSDIDSSTKSRSRDIPFTYIPFKNKRRVDDWVTELTCHVEKNIRGMTIVDAEIAQLVADDGGDGVHGWRYWMFYEGYYDLLNRTQVLVYPNNWSSRRPWEALACGCLLMMEKPTIDMSSYPITDVAPFCTFESKEELLGKVGYLSAHPAQAERTRQEAVKMAFKHFAPVPLARRMLWHLWDRIGG
jgi:hypothetical protein